MSEGDSVSGRGNVKEGWSAWWSFARIPEFPVEADKTALIVIDMTYQQAHRDYGLCIAAFRSGSSRPASKTTSPTISTGSTAWWCPTSCRSSRPSVARARR